MESQDKYHSLHLWNKLFQGNIKENKLIFDNDLAKGDVQSIWISNDIEILKFNYHLRRGVGFTQNRFTPPKTDFVPILLGEPISDSLTIDGGKTLNTKSIAAFCSNAYEALGSKYSADNVGKDIRFVSLRVRKERFLEYVSRTERNKKIFDFSQSFFLYEEFDPSMRLIFERMFSMSEEIEYEQEFHETYAKLLIAKFFQMVNDRQALKEKNKYPQNLHPVIKAKELLSDLKNKDIDLASLARECGLSGSRLRSLFKETFGVTIHQFHNDFKLDESRKMLLEGQRSIMMIALDVGFSSSSHFTTAFKKRYNTTPKEFKNSITDQDYLN